LTAEGRRERREEQDLGLRLETKIRFSGVLCVLGVLGGKQARDPLRGVICITDKLRRIRSRTS
jgi:hypothetical protein